MTFTDWARSATYQQTTDAAKAFAGGYGIGLIYAQAMFGASEGHY